MENRSRIATPCLAAGAVTFATGTLLLCYCPGWFLVAAAFATPAALLGRGRARAAGAILIIASLAGAAVHAAGKIREASRRDPSGVVPADAGDDRPADLKKTNVFVGFKKITGIRLDVNTSDGKEVLWYVPEAKWREFESIFDRGVPYRNAQKRVVYALITITADRNEVVWSVLHMSNGECMLEISQDECWRGIKLRDIVRFVEGCEPRGTAP